MKGLSDFELAEIFSPIEGLVGPISEEARQTYYETYRFTAPEVLSGAIKILIRQIKHRVPPLLSEIDSAIAEAAGEMQSTIKNEFCQRCENSGMFLDDELAKFCSCYLGRKKEAIFRLKTYSEGKIAKYVKEHPPTLPIKGLMERNEELKIWEPTQEEHNRWMEKKRAELEKIKEREVSFRIYKLKKAAGEMAGIIEKIRELKKEKESVENRDDDYVPF